MRRRGREAKPFWAWLTAPTDEDNSLQAVGVLKTVWHLRDIDDSGEPATVRNAHAAALDQAQCLGYCDNDVVQVEAFRVRHSVPRDLAVGPTGPCELKMMLRNACFTTGSTVVTLPAIIHTFVVTLSIALDIISGVSSVVSSIPFRCAVACNGVVLSPSIRR